MLTAHLCACAVLQMLCTHTGLHTYNEQHEPVYAVLTLTKRLRARPFVLWAPIMISYKVLGRFVYDLQTVLHMLCRQVLKDSVACCCYSVKMMPDLCILNSGST